MKKLAQNNASENWKSKIKKKSNINDWIISIEQSNILQ